MTTSSSLPSQLSVVTSYRQISGYHSNMMVITKSAMNELRTHLPYTQLRFHCSKHQGRTFHVTTAANSTGNAVVQYFSGQTDVLPDSCNSFVRMEDDNSRLAAVCSEWGRENGVVNVGKWNANDLQGISDEERVYNLPAYVHISYHWVVSSSRMECDDFNVGVSSGDFWKVFVR